MSKFKKMAAIIQEIVKVEVDLQMKVMRKTITEEIKRELREGTSRKAKPKPKAKPPVQQVSTPEAPIFAMDIVEDLDYDNGLNFQTGNPVLNEILNSTKGGIQQGPSPMGAYPDMGGQKVFDTNSMGAVAAHAGVGGLVPEAGHSGARLDTSTKEGATIAKNLTKDYSQVMAAIKAKSGR